MAKKELDEIVKGAGPFPVVFDIGANTGQWYKHNYHLFPSARFFLFDANPLLNLPARFLGSGTNVDSSQNVKWFNVALSDKETTMDYYSRGTDPGNTGDSFFKEQTQFYRDVDPIKLKTNTLDQFISEHNLPQPDFIKLDVQGSELSILKGASAALELTKMLQIEVAFMPFNKDAPLVEEQFAFLRTHHFVPVFAGKQYYTDNILTHIDLFFVKNTNKYIEKRLFTDDFKD